MLDCCFVMTNQLDKVGLSSTGGSSLPPIGTIVIQLTMGFSCS